MAALSDSEQTQVASMASSVQGNALLSSLPRAMRAIATSPRTLMAMPVQANAPSDSPKNSRLHPAINKGELPTSG